MNKATPLLLLLFITNLSICQVGIGTDTPTATLDINGELRIRSTISTTQLSAAKDSILVVDNLGNSKRISSKLVVNSYLKTVVKGQFLSSALVNLTLLTNKVKIPFDFVEFDINSEFDISTSTFVAKQDGIYSISIQIKANSTVGVATDFGVAIIKNGVLISRNSFANVNVTTINVTPPIRKVDSLVQLITGDSITFEIVSDLPTVSILGENEDCYFTIQQIR